MNKKELLVRFIRSIERRKKLTLFIKTVFEYLELNDFNYLFRMIDEDNRVIIDIYDNVRNNRFNRYIFLFDACDGLTFKISESNNVFVTYIAVNNIKINRCNNMLMKFIYIFNNENNNPYEYAATFLDSEILDILSYVMKKIG